ncbi:sensor histidine kinase [Longispora urticae]
MRRAAGPPRLRSIRLQLLLPILISTLGLGALGTQQTSTALAAENDAVRARVLAGTATATVGLIHELEREVAETGALRLRNGKVADQILLAQRRRTDAALVRYRGATQLDVPELFSPLTTAGSALAGLPTARGQALGMSGEQRVADQSYRSVVTLLLAVAEALPARIDDAALAGRTRAIAALAAAGHLAAEERDLLRGVFTRGAYAPGELSALASLIGSAEARQAEFYRVADDGGRAAYDHTVTGSDVDIARGLRDDALTGDQDPGRLRIDPDAWYVAQTQLLRRLYTVQLALATELDDAAYARQEAARRSTVLALALTGAVAVLSVLTALVLSARTARRLRRLRRAALNVANQSLPAAIAAVSVATEPGVVRDTHLAVAAATDTSLTAGFDDEIGQVGTAFGTLHRQALRLAADQALLRIDVAATLVSLSRRGQALINRQLQLLDDLERTESDPDTLGQLFALDHLAARMRRNEENLLLLAGGEPGRRFSHVELLEDVVRAAAAEIEEYPRVDTADLAGLAIVGAAVGDLVHLLAELLENAATFSPPDSRVSVTARHSIDGLDITIYDQGIGIPDASLDEVNARLAQPAALTAALAGTMGLLVVARLAARQGIEVTLRSHTGNGTAALVRLPNTLLAPVTGLRPRTAPSGAVARAFLRPPEPEPDPTAIDPEEIRSRLSSLAIGITAAAGHLSPHPGRADLD